MNNTLRKFQETMMAATFAEAGEWETARRMAPDTELSRKSSWVDKIFTAVTFAEYGLHNDAIDILEPARRHNRGFNSVIAENLGLQGVQLTYGTVSI